MEGEHGSNRLHRCCVRRDKTIALGQRQKMDALVELDAFKARWIEPVFTTYTLAAA